jgi:ABC-type glycerol-3-phosphate transport system substrate-binding protein
MKRAVFVFCLVLLAGAFVWAQAPESNYISRADIKSELMEAKINWMAYKGQSINLALQSESDIWDMERLQLFKLFEELTGIKVNYTIFEEEQLREKTTVDFMAGTGIYDAAMSDVMYLAGYAKANKVADLKRYLNDPKLTDIKWFNPDDFPPAFRQMGTFDGKIFGWPLHWSGQMLYWNKVYFKKYGLDPEKGPDNMDQLLAFARKAHHPEDGVYGVALRGLRGGGLNVFAWSSFMRAFGGQWFDKNWKSQINTKPVIDSIKYYSNLITTYGPPGVSNWEWSKIMTGMAEGTIAITVDAPTFSYVTEDASKSKTVGQWGYGPNPAGPVKRATTPYSWYWTMNQASKRKEATWLFIQYVVSKPIEVALGGPVTALARRSVIDDPVFEQGNPWLPAWKKAMFANAAYADPQARPVIPEWPEVGDIMGEELESVIAGKKSAEDAAKAAAARIDQVMKEAGY